jgi:hypothetical protein
LTRCRQTRTCACCDLNWVSNAFVRDTLLPAVRANASLRKRAEN